MPRPASASHSSPVEYYGWDTHICQSLERIAIALEKIAEILQNRESSIG